MPLDVTWSDDELPGLRQLVDRAMNTWEPANRPDWVQEFSDAVDRRIKEAKDVREADNGVQE